MTTPPAAGNSHAPVDHQHMRQLILAERASIKLDRQTFLRMIASGQTAEQVIADLVAMFTHITDKPPTAAGR
jgi:hypothetical protein